jgi:hypothetical protein
VAQSLLKEVEPNYNNEEQKLLEANIEIKNLITLLETKYEQT